jgi:hypothetical protein
MYFDDEKARSLSSGVSEERKRRETSGNPEPEIAPLSSSHVGIVMAVVAKLDD